MPYNTTAIPPRKEATGQTQLPLTRVKKIIAQDEDVNVCSNNAAFVITLATEMFIQYLATEGLNNAKLERKPRRNIQYKDLASAVSNHDNLEFLSDIVPKTVPFKAIKDKVAATRSQLNGGAKSNGNSLAAGNEDGNMNVDDDEEVGDHEHGDNNEDGQQGGAAARRSTNGSGSNKKHKASLSRVSIGSAGAANISELLSGGVAGSNNASRVASEEAATAADHQEEEAAAAAAQQQQQQQQGGKKQKKNGSEKKRGRPSNASLAAAAAAAAATAPTVAADEDEDEDPNDQLELEMRQARNERGDDVEMAD